MIVTLVSFNTNLKTQSILSALENDNMNFVLSKAKKSK